MNDKTAEECPFSSCPGHDHPGEPCWGEMTCYDEMDYGDGDYTCLLACDGHHEQAFYDMALSGITKSPRPPYEPRSL